jgi:hypothetical protein
MAKYLVLVRGSGMPSTLSPQEMQKVVQKYMNWSEDLRKAGRVAHAEKLRFGEADPALARYYLLPAALGRLWLETGDAERAAQYYRAALARPCSAPERRFLERQLTKCRRSAPR